jgi:hypothetical protein
LSSLAEVAPPMAGAEYLTGASLTVLWQELDAAFAAELLESGVEESDFVP